MDLRSILTSELYLAILKAMVPYEKGKPVDLDTILGGPEQEKLKEISFPALKQLSTVGLESFPDLLSYLPVPNSPDFPEQALGLTLLLDQAVRACSKGVDVRYVHGYFNVLGLRLAMQLYAMPDEVKPWTVQRWTDIGYSFDYWIVACSWFIAPFAHSDTMQSKHIEVEMADQFRKALEAKCGREDPYYKDREANMKDLFAMPRIIPKGPPKTPERPREDVVFWIYVMHDIHYPIVERFGRYPYLNEEMGRDSTEEEREYLQKMGYKNSNLTEEEVRHIREDVRAGRWTPFGQGRA